MQSTTSTQATCANTNRSTALVIADEVVCSPPRKILMKNKLLEINKGVGIAIKSNETSSKLAIWLIMQTQLQLGRYVHVCINETHSLANLQDLIPTLAGIIISSTIQPK